MTRAMSLSLEERLRMSSRTPDNRCLLTACHHARSFVVYDDTDM